MPVDRVPHQGQLETAPARHPPPPARVNWTCADGGRPTRPRRPPGRCTTALTAGRLPAPARRPGPSTPRVCHQPRTVARPCGTARDPVPCAGALRERSRALGPSTTVAVPPPSANSSGTRTRPSSPQPSATRTRFSSITASRRREHGAATRPLPDDLDHRKHDADGCGRAAVGPADKHSHRRGDAGARPARVGLPKA